MIDKLHLRIIKLYLRNTLVVSYKLFTQIENESILENVIMNLKKIISSVNLLSVIHPSRIEKLKELNKQLWVLL